MGRGNKLLRFALWASGAYFMFFVLWKLGLVGVDNDDARLGLWMISAVDEFKTAGFVKLSGQLMEYPYCGRLGSFFFLPFVLSGHTSIFFFRLSSVPLILVGLGCMYLLIKNWFNVLTARVLLLLLLTNSFFIRVVRIASKRDELYQVAFFWIALYLFDAAVRRKKPYIFALGTFVCGLAFWTKIMFLGYLIAAAAAVVCVFPTLLKFCKGRSYLNTKKYIIIGVIGFLLGSLPWITSNMAHGWGTFSFFWDAATQVRPGGWNNWNIVQNLGFRLSHLRSFFMSAPGPLDGVYMHKDLFSLVLYSVSGAIVAGFLFYKTKLPDFSKARVVFLLVLFAVLFLLTCFVPVSGIPAHIVILFPLPQLLVALALGILLGFSKNRVTQGVVVLVLCVQCFVQISQHRVYLDALKNGAYKMADWSGLPAAVADYFNQNTPLNPVLVSLVDGVEQNVVFGACGRVTLAGQWDVHPVFEKLPEYYEQKIKPLGDFYLLVPVEFSPRDINSNIFAMISQKRTLSKCYDFTSRSGETAFRLYKVSV